jgi:hypothetical protein
MNDVYDWGYPHDETETSISLFVDPLHVLLMNGRISSVASTPHVAA